MTVHWSALAAARQPAVAVIEELGRDRALTPADLHPSNGLRPDVVRAAWAVYDRHFGRFCGARLDPQFWRLEHPAAWSGMPIVTDGTPMVIVGTGPSLRAGLDDLRRHRDRIHVVTSPRGADALEDAGLIPDVVVIEHQTPVDAQFSVHALTERRRHWRAHVALVVTSGHTPSALVADVPPDRLVHLDPLPTWGLWPATAAAMAVASGARAVALLGVDLGSRERPDPRQHALRDLLSLVVMGAHVMCVDLGIGGSSKIGWMPEHLAAIVDCGVRRPLGVARMPARPTSERRAAAVAAWRRTTPVADSARVALDAADRVRDGDRSLGAIADLVRRLAHLLECGQDPRVRQDVQDSLGCAFLPRYWRTPPDLALGAALWRSTALAAHEIVHQHRALGCRIGANGAARGGEA